LSVSKILSLQLDKSCDISGYVQLIAYIRYIEGKYLKTNFFFCKNLPEKRTGEEIFRVTDVYIRENNLRWEDTVSICTDGAASMTGKVKGLKDKVHEVNPEIRFDHCFLHREAIVAKILPAPLQSVLDEVVKIVNSSNHSVCNIIGVPVRIAYYIWCAEHWLLLKQYPIHLRGLRIKPGPSVYEA
jgi:hypothetical protein